jgi:galactose mutarotase-like enzyme
MTGDFILTRGDSFARISQRGAELRQWRCAGQELLWPGDPAIWPQTSPILFPLVGWARNGRISVDGVDYPIHVHGFAASQDFEPIAHCDRHVHLRLTQSPQTLQHYPFAFALDVHYRLQESGLSITLQVANGSDRIMPYACGLHPGFCWPLAGGARGEHWVEFGADEPPFVPKIAEGGLFSPHMRPIALMGRELRLNPGLLDQEALCFLKAKSQWLRLHNGQGQGIEISTGDFPHWALWSLPEAPFVCIESWTGHGDPVDFSGDLMQKPSMIHLRPGESRQHEAHYRFFTA